MFKRCQSNYRRSVEIRAESDIGLAGSGDKYIDLMLQRFTLDGSLKATLSLLRAGRSNRPQSGVIYSTFCLG